MIRAAVEMFINDRRVYKMVDLRDLAKEKFDDFLSVGIDTGLTDKDGHPVYSNQFVKFKGNLCRLTVAEGQFMIKHPKFGLQPLTKWFSECQVIR